MSDKILITGACGFIGSHLTEKCVELGFEVRAFDRYNSNNHWGWLENSPYKKDFEVFLGDIRDYDSVLNAVDGCGTVFHLAALIGIPYSYLSPLAYIETNIKGTYNVLQAARQFNTEQVLLTSTSETYGSAQYTPIDEKHPLQAQSPYSASKISADQLGMSYYNSFDIPVKIVRPFNVYGPRQSSRAVIPTIVTQILNKTPRLHLGNLSPTRDFTFVKDTINGFLEIHKASGLTGQVTNIGMNEEISIGELAETIASIMQTEVSIDSTEDRVRPDRSEVKQLRCDNSRLTQNTDWAPQYNLIQGLTETVDWIRQNFSLFKPEHCTV